MSDEHRPGDDEPRTPQSEPRSGSPENQASWPFAAPSGEQPTAPQQPPRPSPPPPGVPQAPGQYSPWSRTGAPESVWSSGQQPQGYPAGGPPLPPPGYTSAYAAPEPPHRRRRASAAMVAVVVAALLGGAAGAAVESQWGDDNGKTVVSSLAAPPVKNTAADKAPAGSVQKVAAQVLPSVVSITVALGDGSGDSGSGVVLTSDGKIMTNNHVVSPAQNGNAKISVTFHDGTTKAAHIIGTDKVTDLAVIKVDGVDNLQPAALGRSGDLAVGQPVVAIGSPLNLSGTVTTGIVSALNRPVNTSDQEDPGQGGGNGGGGGLPGFPGGGSGSGGNQAVQATVIDAIQTDAAINPGNSGGALVNMNGEVVGINQSIATSGSGGLDGSQAGNIGIGFAIPMDEARPIVNELIKNGKAEHAQLGVSVTDAANNNGVGTGALLHDVTGKSAKDAGLKDGDVITQVGDRQIDNGDALIAAVRSHRPGDTITLTYKRGGSSHTTQATLGSDS
ncbi:MAG TPA: trypsin-like peptidase domain-containing protein [Mycobacteriales bacterium]|nr:trypsin-like peptidase domain-containing protein [Mycobacteriales bacterium]